MITLEHIKKLDEKVRLAVGLIGTLRNDNAALQKKLDQYEKRIGELEVLIESFKKDQTEIENGIVRALEALDELEDLASVPSQDEAGEPQTSQVDSDQGNSEGAAESRDADEGELDIF
jgi:hypothetical protein